MLITAVEQSKNKRYRIYGDDTFQFALYKTEMNQFGIKENAEIENKIMQKIREEIVLKRAKERALYLLDRTPLTVHTLKDKLKQSDYPVIVVDRVVEFLEEYHYLDDQEYVKMYVKSYANKKNKKQIQYDLYRKGISRELVENYFAQHEYSEDACFEKQFFRYIRGKNLQDRTMRQKVFRYFYGKGFSASVINAYLKDERFVE